MPSRSVIHSPAHVAWRAAAVLVGAVLLVVASVAGVNAWNAGVALNVQFTTIPDALPGEQHDGRAGPRPPGAATGGAHAAAQNILVLGVDSPRTDAGKAPGAPVSPSADTVTSIMVVNIPAERRSVSVLSVLPSTSVDAEGAPQRTVREALASGVDAAVGTVQTLIDARIHRVAVVDIEAVAVMVDAVGGVDPAGGSARAIVGEEALDLLREPAPEGQPGSSSRVLAEARRALTEQSILSALFASIEREGTFESLRKTGALATKVSRFIAVDDGLTVGYLSSLRLSLRDLSTDIVFGALPAVAGPSTTGDSPPGEAIVPDPSALAVVREAIARDSLHRALRAGLTPAS